MIENGIVFFEQKEYLLVVLSVIIMGLTLWLVVTSFKALIKKR